jgi:hypothetical protein
MKNMFLIAIMALILCACNSDGPGNNNNSQSNGELTLNRSVAGTISTEGEVDLYHIRINDANTILNVSVEGDTVHPDVDLLVTAYQDEVSEDNRLMADHAPENAYLPADIDINIYINQPKDIYIAVRDLMDDEADPEQRYHLTVSTAAMEEENNDFSSATQLTVDNQGSTVTEKIDYVGDKDCFAFNISQEGIYSIQIEYSPFVGGTQVRPAARLFGPDGAMIDSTNNITGNGFKFLTHLTPSANPYHVVIEDTGNDDSDQSSSYKINIVSLDSDEVYQNDSEDEAIQMTLSGGNTYSALAALDYASSSEDPDHFGDRDWYFIPVDSINVSGIKVIDFTMADQDNIRNLDYRISLMEESGAVLFTHDYNGGNNPYRCQIKAGTGNHYLLVQSAGTDRVQESAAYSVDVEVIGVTDPAEAGNGNNTESNATLITSGVNTEGKIAFRSDVDWYRIQVPTDSPKILEVSLESAESMVEYDVQIRLNNNTLKRQYDTNGSDAVTKLSTSIYIDANSQTTTDYYIRVADYQDDDGDSIPYNLLVNVVPIAPDATVSTAPGNEYRYYFSEVEERAMDASRSTDLELEIWTTEQPEFKADTSLLNFRVSDLAALHITKTNNPDGTVTITFPWIAGFVDYQGDRDFFKLDLKTLDPAVPDTQWYYDVEIRLATRVATDVEYNWKFYRDHNGNGIIMDNPGADDGYKANNGDITLSSEPIDITTPSGTETFYVGDRWTTENPRDYSVYIGMSDFDYRNLPTSNPNDPVVNPDPDNDWGYDAPYYFKVVLTYHPGVSYPQ